MKPQNHKLKLVEKLATVCPPKEFQVFKKHFAEYSEEKIIELISHYQNKK